VPTLAAGPAGAAWPHPAASPAAATVASSTQAARQRRASRAGPGRGEPGRPGPGHDGGIRVAVTWWRSGSRTAVR
jgi:hypothetical protein